MQPPPYDPMRQGYQAPFAPRYAPGPPPPKSWLSRNPGLAIGIGCSGLALLVCLFIGGILAIVTTAMRSSDAYQVAFGTASRHPAVIAELGAPVKAGWFTSGQVNVAGAAGHANLSIPISGPRAAGTISAVADKVAGKWTFSTLSVTVDGRPATIDLLPALPAAPPP